MGGGLPCSSSSLFRAQFRSDSDNSQVSPEIINQAGQIPGKKEKQRNNRGEVSESSTDLSCGVGKLHCALAAGRVRAIE